MSESDTQRCDTADRLLNDVMRDAKMWREQGMGFRCYYCRKMFRGDAASAHFGEEYGIPPVCARTAVLEAKRLSYFLTNKMRENASLQSRLDAALLDARRVADHLRAAYCGNCGNKGWTAIQVEDGVFDQEPCQWCAIRCELIGDAALASES